MERAEAAVPALVSELALVLVPELVPELAPVLGLAWVSVPALELDLTEAHH